MRQTYQFKNITLTEYRNKTGELHNDNGPAVIINTAPLHESYYYYKNGKLDRDDGPAIRCLYNCQCHQYAEEQCPDECFMHREWYKKGVLHNDNGPAYIKIEPYQRSKIIIWYQHGKMHNLYGPSYILQNSDGYRYSGFKIWYCKGRKHRFNGPTMYTIFSDDDSPTEWYINDIRCTPEYILEYQRALKFKYFHFWYEKIYQNLKSDFVNTQLLNSYDELVLENIISSN
jgi:hypothetical protein